MDAVIDNFDDVLTGFGYTLALFLVCAVLSLVLGTILVAMRVGPIWVLSKAAGVFVTLIRNTPLVMLFFMFHFAFTVIGVNFKWFAVHIGPFDFTNAYATAVVALSLYTSTFVCEALRSGVNSVPIGQAEAARAIGLPFGGVMTNVMLPQAFRASIPPVTSALIAMLKNTSVSGVFFLYDALSEMSDLLRQFPGQQLAIFMAFALGYIILVEIVSLISQVIERRVRVA